MKNVKFKFIKTATGCHYVGYFCYCENLNWAAQNPRLGRMRPTGRGLDMADLSRSYIEANEALASVNFL